MIKVNEKVYHVHIDGGNPSAMLPESMGLQKGDLIVYKGNGHAVRFKVGANGKFLMADPSAELGVRWADPSTTGAAVTTELKNITGATIAAGTIVYGVKGETSDSYLYMYKAQPYSAGQLYVVADDVETGEVGACYFVPGTVCYVLCDSAEVKIGDGLVVSSTAGICTSIGEDQVPTVGVALSAKASGSADIVKCWLCSNDTIEIYNGSDGSTSRGTVFRFAYDAEHEGNVNKAAAGSIPDGVQACPSISSGGNGIMKHKHGDNAMVICDTSEVKNGDWLIPSATAGQVKAGTGYGIGYAMGSKDAGASGLVKCLLRPGQYGKTTRFWYMSDQMEEDDIIAAWRFAGAISEAAALANVNNGDSYPLTKILGTESWDETNGFVIPATASAGLTNADILAMADEVHSAILVFDGVDITRTYIQAGGIALSKNRVLQIGPQGGTSTNTSSSVNAFARNLHASSVNLYKGTRPASGVLGATWTATGGDTYLDGVAVEMAKASLSVGSIITNALGVIAQNSGALAYRQTFNVKEVVLYNKELTAEDFAEIYAKIAALNA